MWKKISCFLLLVIISNSCFAAARSKEDTRTTETIKTYSAWVPYWDWENGVKESRSGDVQFDSIVAFAMHFDGDYKLELPQGISERDFDKLVRSQTGTVYLSIVNDRIRKNNKSSFKDVNLLRRILENDSSMDAHIEEILTLSTKMGFDGIEIDYENIWRDINVIAAFPHFVKKLYQAAETRGIKIRIVLEPKSMSIAGALPEGPEYVVMFYNLYGTHSGPGPKANKVFIEKLLRQVITIKGTKNAAFATGGFVWPGKGRIRALSEGEAVELARRMRVEVKRDTGSQCLYYQYKEKGIENSVWYADAVTLKYWVDIASDHGISHFSFWRLGNNFTLSEVLEKQN